MESHDQLTTDFPVESHGQLTTDFPVESQGQLTTGFPVESHRHLTKAFPVESHGQLTKCFPVESHGQLTTGFPVESHGQLTTGFPVESHGQLTTGFPVESHDQLTQIWPVFSAVFDMLISQVSLFLFTEGSTGMHQLSALLIGFGCCCCHSKHSFPLKGSSHVDRFPFCDHKQAKVTDMKTEEDVCDECVQFVCYSAQKASTIVIKECLST